VIDYQATFVAIESTLLSIGSPGLSPEETKLRLEPYKGTPTECPADDDCYSMLVDAIFYSGLPEPIVIDKLPVVHRHFRNYREVANFGEGEVEAILSDKAMIRNPRKIQACAHNAKALAEIGNEFGSLRLYIDSFEARDSAGRFILLKEDLQARFVHFGDYTAYRFLADVGLPVLLPDPIVERIFARLGILQAGPERNTLIHHGQLLKEQFSYAFKRLWPTLVIREGMTFAEQTALPIRYIEAVFKLYGQAICLETKPRCSECEANKDCEFYAKDQITAVA
jgi:3-methyladenine DNA glycosylase Tag